MNFWQSLLIACIPAIIALIASIIVSNKEIKKIKEESKLRYQSEKKLYISKTRFDLEISIYKELSEKFLEMIYKVAMLFPRGIYQESANFEEKIENRKANHSRAIKTFLDAHQALMKYAPFIPEMFYEEFNKILELCKIQINLYPEFMLQKQDRDYGKELLKEERDCWKRTETIMTQSDDLTKKLREYLNSLDVKEKKE